MFVTEDIVRALIGGVLIGLSSSILLVKRGKIFGVSGLLGFSIEDFKNNKWRFAMVLFLVLGGGISNYLLEGGIGVREYEYRPYLYLIFGGLLIGYGTRLGSGCTSGHGICGVSRLSPRSIVATMTFMAGGIIVVYLIREFFGG